MRLTNRALTTLFILPLLWIGCGGSSNKVTIAVTPVSSTLNVGAQQQLTATVTKSGQGSVNATSSVSWSSSDSTVASISASGLATAVGPGSATITAAIDGVSGTAQVTVGGGVVDLSPPADMNTPDMTAAPTLTGIAPPRGPAAGGTPVVLTGTGLTSVTAVEFGTTAATSFTVNSDTQITAISPAGTGAVNVTVVAPSGTSNSVAFGYGNAPVVTGIVPSAGLGAGGTSVTLTGSALTGVTSVTFGTAVATSFTVVSDSQITAVSPANADGSVDVVVVSPFGTSNSVTFTYGELPTLASLSPTSGTTLGGTTVTLTGTNLAGATKVSFGTTDVTTVTATSNTQISVSSPAHAAGAVSVTITTPFGVTSGTTFTYVAPPVLTTATPSSSPSGGGGTIVIKGQNLTGTTSVLFGNTAATFFSVVSSTEVDAIAPAGTSSVNLTVVTPYGTSNGLAFGYGASPVVTSISPSVGVANATTNVTIYGSGFTTTPSVLFGTTPATSVSVDMAGAITAVAPAQAAGPVQVTVVTSFGTSNGVTFTYGTPPTLTTATPNQGTTAGGTTVVLTGNDLTGATAVAFGATTASLFTVDSNTQITVSAPAQAAGSVVISVTTPYGTSSTTTGPSFTYGTSPAITGISPASGPIAGGTSVQLNGTSLGSVTSVTFGGVNASITSQSATQVTATAPAVTSPTTVNVTVTSPYGSASTLFTYGNAPVIAQVVPAYGLTAGGTAVTLQGSAFTGVTSVTFGSGTVPFTYVSDTQLNVTSPADTVGSVNIYVTTPYGTSNGGLFTYGVVPSISSISPSAGKSAGGDTVTIEGMALGSVANTEVTFDGMAATIVSISTDGTTAVVTTPPHAAGSVTVELATQYGNATTSFTYDDPPTLTSTAPTSGTTAGGDTVTLTGTNLADATQVTFGGAAGTITATSATTLTVTTPAGSGTVDIVVTTPGGTATLSQAFTYDAPAPTVTSLGTTSGSHNGGTTVVLTGTGFTGATAVDFGAAAATSFIVNSDTQITAVSPAGSGAVDVTVTASSGTSSMSSADVFTYTPGVLDGAFNFGDELVAQGAGLAWLGTANSSYLIYGSFTTSIAPGTPLSDFANQGSPTSVSSTEIDQQGVPANSEFVFICAATATQYSGDDCTNVVNEEQP